MAEKKRIQLNLQRMSLLLNDISRRFAEVLSVSRPMKAWSAGASNAASARAISRPMVRACAIGAEADRARLVIGLDPRQRQLVYDAMDGALKGHAYTKVALDIACWDLLGRATGLAMRDLLGGGYRERLPLYLGIGIDTPERMRAVCERAIETGYRRIMLKVGTDVPTDIKRVETGLAVLEGCERVIVDANGFWTQHDARPCRCGAGRARRLFEQPCATMEQCAAVRRRSSRPFVLDESIETMDDLPPRTPDRCGGCRHASKFSRFGGITPTVAPATCALQLGFAMTIEDSAGGDIVSAAMAQVGATIPDHALINGSLIGRMVEERHATDWSPLEGGGFGIMPPGPGPRHHRR